MDLIDNLQLINPFKFTFHYNSDDIIRLNLLRRALMSEVETYTIDIVVFHINTSIRHDEVIALRLGQLPIDNEAYTGGDNFKVRVELESDENNYVFTTDDIPSIPFKYSTPILELRKGQKLVCDLIIKKGIGKTHVKWRPIANFSIKNADKYGYNIEITHLDMFNPENLLKMGFDKIDQASKYKPLTIFTQPAK